MPASSIGAAVAPGVDPTMSTVFLRHLLPVLIGAAAGAALGYYGSCTDGTCPLTATWWRGALYGGFLGLIIALGNKSS